jgi:hypothetical protein
LDTILREMLARIDRKMEALQRARATLIEEFAERDTGATANVPNGDPMHALEASLRAQREAEPKLKRKEEIVEFLLNAGPRTRKHICELTGIPEGTVAFEMRDRDTFKHNSDGRWDITEAVRSQRMSLVHSEPPDIDY